MLDITDTDRSKNVNNINILEQDGRHAESQMPRKNDTTIAAASLQQSGLLGYSAPSDSEVLSMIRE